MSDQRDAGQDAVATKPLPPGEYAIVELFGHVTLVGRVSDAERFGAKMLALEPIFRGELLPPVLHGGAAIYRMTPCSAEIAFGRQHREVWQLPPTLRAIVPAALLEAPSTVTLDGNDDDNPDRDPPY